MIMIVLLPTFKAVGQTQAGLHILEVGKMDAYLRPLFANPATYMYIYIYDA